MSTHTKELRTVNKVIHGTTNKNGSKESLLGWIAEIGF